MFPLAVYVIGGRKWVRNAVGVVAVSVWGLAWADTIRTGGHWPLDQVAGFLIAASLLVVVYSLDGDVRQHESCDECALEPDAP